MELLLWVLAFVAVIILVSMLLFLSTRRSREAPPLAYLETLTEPEAHQWVSRLRSAGIWADVRHIGGVSTISIELGSWRGYEVWVLAKDEKAARELLGL
jgi:hypothetical protein